MSPPTKGRFRAAVSALPTGRFRFGSVLAATIIEFMPSKWEERMGTMATYEEDGSAMGRIDAWLMLYNLAVDRPVVGGGFEPYTDEVCQCYNPNFDKPQVAHSIYFQVLGEHGEAGPSAVAAELSAAMFLNTFVRDSRSIRPTSRRPRTSDACITLAIEASAGTSEQFGWHISAQYAHWREQTRRLGIKLH